MFMTELNWLLAFDPLAGVPGRTIYLNSNPQQGKSNEDSAINRNFRQRVGAVMEDLWHCRRILSVSGVSQTGTLADKEPTKPLRTHDVYC